MIVMSEHREHKRRQMVELLEPLLPKSEFFESTVKGVCLFRIDSSFPRKPTQYGSRIIIMAQGEKRVFLGEETYTYDPAQYLVLAVPMPIECEGIAAPGKPILGFWIDVEPTEVAEILMAVDDLQYSGESVPKGIFGASMTDALADASVRLLQALNSRAEGRVLGRTIAREIIFRVLMGENGAALRALAYRNRRFFQISQILNKIHSAFDDSIDVRTLAIDAGMSVSTFHSCFKAITNTSPIQYIKNVRLHKARTLMAQQGLNALSAALRVGYESPSQFSREYKRYFGVTPAKDCTGMKATG